MLPSDVRQVICKGTADTSGQHRDTVDASLAIPDADLSTIEVHVLDPKRQALEQPKPRSVEEIADKSHRPLKPAKNRRDFGSGQDDGQANRAVRTNQGSAPLSRPAKDLAVQKQDRAERLILR